MLGVMPTNEAMRLARDAGMDLVEVSPNERPPVCRIMDYGKHKYNQAKKLKQRHHEQKIKEVRLRPKTDLHDREIKLKRAQGFLEQGDRVQFTMLFRGRERFHREVGLGIFNEIVKTFEQIAKVDRPARALGRRMTMVLAPLKAASPSKAKAKQKSPTPTKPKRPKAEATAPAADSTPAPVQGDEAAASQSSPPAEPPQPAEPPASAGG